MRLIRPGAILISAYALLLLAAVVSVPLRLSEILQLIGSSYHSIPKLIGWVAQTPASAPLNYFVQLPFVLGARPSRIAARVPSVLFALGSSYLFLRLANRLRLRSPYFALAAFMLLPVHYRLATQGRPAEQALFLLLLATLCYLRLIQAPDMRAAAVYGGLLVLCLYTDPSSYLPAIGYLIFLVRFLNRADGRRVLWFALPATVIPVLLFLPYYVWSHPQANANWIFENFNYPANFPIFLQLLHSAAAGGWSGYVIAGLLLAGTFGGGWAFLRGTTGVTTRDLPMACLFGGVISATVIPMTIDAWKSYSFSPTHLLWAVPGIIILSFAALEFLIRKDLIDPLTMGFALALIVLSGISDAGYIGYRAEDLQYEAAMIRPELTGDSCIVFVSEGLSKSMFLLFDPSLDSHECLNFFHKRLVLASHPYVQPGQQHYAESYFTGLNFAKRKRIRAGGGQIVIMEQNR